jgi:hypothetical protein
MRVTFARVINYQPCPTFYHRANKFYRTIELAGAGGFEPPHDGIKNRCLTAWPRPNIFKNARLKSRIGNI